jgi:hypothetical protein
MKISLCTFLFLLLTTCAFSAVTPEEILAKVIQITGLKEKPLSIEVSETHQELCKKYGNEHCPVAFVDFRTLICTQEGCKTFPVIHVSKDQVTARILAHEFVHALESDPTDESYPMAVSLHF